MMKNMKNRLAFTMLELVFVITILGIVASIGAELIAKVYDNYIVQRAQHRASIKTQLAMNQITNRLRYIIRDTDIRRVTKAGTPELLTDDLLIDSTGKTYNVLQWVASDGDSFEAITSSTSTGVARRPGWSGFCDLNASSTTTIATPGSNLDLAEDIISYLGGDIANSIIYFPYGVSYAVASGSGESITLDSAIPSGSEIYERYKLAWTSYALVVEDNAKGKKDLNLYYNFPPTFGATIGTTKSLLLKNVTNFKFERRGETIRIKLCVEEQIGDTATIPACKEKAVF